MTESTVNKITKRRFFRFSLRTFLIVLTILCVWIGWYLYRVEQQREAVKWILENGGWAYYDYEIDDKKLIGDSQPFVPRWLLDKLGVDYFHTVEGLYVFRVSDISLLASLTNLERLFLKETQVSDFSPLASLANLEVLDLGNTQVSDVKPLAGLPNLEVLDLRSTQVSDVKPLAGLTNLEVLRLDSTQVSDVKPLAGLTNLIILDLRYTQVRHEDIEKLKQALPNCTIFP